MNGEETQTVLGWRERILSSVFAPEPVKEKKARKKLESLIEKKIKKTESSLSGDFVWKHFPFNHENPINFATRTESDGKKSPANQTNRLFILKHELGSE